MKKCMLHYLQWSGHIIKNTPVMLLSLVRSCNEKMHVTLLAMVRTYNKKHTSLLCYFHWSGHVMKHTQNVTVIGQDIR